MIKPRALLSPVSILFLLVALSAQAAEPQQPSKEEASEEELVKQTQNPVASVCRSRITSTSPRAQSIITCFTS
jgi:hypothetical protein